MRYQDLSKFSVPDEFRGRGKILVQLWWLVDVLFFRASPQFMYGWRRFLLKVFGASVGKNVIIRPSAKITYPWKVSLGDNSWIGDDVVLYSLGRIAIGKNSVISQRSYICTGDHDMNSISFDIRARDVVIEDEVWLCTDVFVAPGVSICSGVVVGARSSVFKNLTKTGVYNGSPAKFIRER